jgi:hypothetical protein
MLDTIQTQSLPYLGFALVTKYYFTSEFFENLFIEKNNFKIKKQLRSRTSEFQLIKNSKKIFLIITNLLLEHI